MVSISYGLIIELSRNEKLQKYRIILSQHTTYLHRWLVTFWYVYCCNVYIFSGKFLNVCKPRTTTYPLWQPGPPGLAFYGSGLACLPSWLGMVNEGWLCSMRSEIFLQMKFIIFEGCPTKLGQPAPYNQLLIQPL